jgi:hypothetical protein
MNWRWLWAGVLLTTVFILVQCPTRFIVPFLPLPPSISLSEATGTPWHGGVCIATPLLPDKACTNWQWQPKAILTGKLAYDVNAHIANSTTQANAEASFAGWHINGALSVPVGQRIPDWANWLPTGATASEKTIDFSENW